MRKFIEKLESFSEELSDKKRRLIYSSVAVVCAIGLLAMVAIPIYQSQTKLNEEKKQILLQIENLKLNQFEARKNSLNQQKMQKASQVQEYRQEFLSQMSRYKKEQFVYFSNATMTKFLDLVMKNSLKHKLNIQSVQNQPVQNPPFYYGIEIKGEGSYNDIVKYLYGLLRYKAILSLKKFAIFLNEEHKVEFILLFELGGE